MSLGTKWRISPFPDLHGIGGTKASGRWHSVGRPIVYLAESPASAMLETLVHLEMEAEDVPDGFNLIAVEIPAAAEIYIPDDLPDDWYEDVEATREMGDVWLRENETLLMRVPSAIMPHTQNLLFNPAHPHAKEATLTYEEFILDRRLLGPRK